VHSSYDEGLLFENAMDKPVAFARGMWPMLRAKRLSAQVAMGGFAPNVKLIDGTTGKEIYLYEYQSANRLLVLNFGSQS